MVEYPHGQVRAVTHYGVHGRRHRDRHRRDARGAGRDDAGDRVARATHRRDRLIPGRPAPAGRDDHRDHDRQERSCDRLDLRARPAASRAMPPDAGRSTTRSTTSSRPASVGSSGTTPSSGRPSASTTHDDQLGDGGREAVLAELAAERAHLAAGRGASTPPASRRRPGFERDLELHNVRRAIFDTDVLRIWERRSFALDTIGDGLFLLFARDHAPLAERLTAIAGRLEGVPQLPRGRRKTRATVPQVRLWQQHRDRDRGRAARLLRRDRRPPGTASSRRPSSAAGWRAPARPPRSRSSCTRTWLEGTLAGRHRRLADRPRAARRAWSPCGRSTASTPTRSSSSAGRSWPRRRRPARRRRARSTRTPTEAEVIDRVKSDQPGRLRGGARGLPRRDAPRARAPHRARPRDRARRRADRRRRRRPSTCATSSRSPPTSSRRRSIATRRASTSSRRRSTATPNAMREHNFASISNTSIHEAYPGHHLQLDAARRHPSLTRLMADAPEFVEGWGMYSRADDARARLRRRPALPRDHAHRRDLAGLPDHPRRPDAPRRADASTRRPTSSSSRPTSSGPTPAPRSQLVHLPPDLSPVVPARPDAAARACAPTSSAGSATRSRSRASTTRCCATARCRSASTAACWPARAPERRVQVIPAIDLEGGRSRIVYWPGAAAGIGAPTDRPDRIAERFVAMGATLDPPRRLRGGARRQPGQPRGGRGDRRRGSRSRSSWPAASIRPRRSSWRSRPARPGSC